MIVVATKTRRLGLPDVIAAGMNGYALRSLRTLCSRSWRCMNANSPDCLAKYAAAFFGMSRAPR